MGLLDILGETTVCLDTAPILGYAEDVPSYADLLRITLLDDFVGL